VFHDLIYYVQNFQLFQQGYLSKIRYVQPYKPFDRSRLKLNSTGADYTDESVKKYYEKINFKEQAAVAAIDAIYNRKRKNALVFTRFVEEARYIVQRVADSAIVTAESSKAEREGLIEGFRTGRIKTVCNVGVLTTGFDYPELETIIMARPTKSLALYYQMIGRGIRPHPEKEYTEAIDLCGNGDEFGRIEDLKLIDGQNGKYFIQGTGGKQLTNAYFGEPPKKDYRGRYDERTTTRISH
jgi:DNA repair protein RadD